MRYSALVLLSFVSGAQAQALPPNFVYLRDIDPSIVQDMRYAGTNNFTGRSLPGYGAAECVLRRDAAVALKQVQEDLRATGLSLKVYDCYRPQRAVNGMARWAQASEDGRTRHSYPGLDKHTLFQQGWIAYRSRHSAGIAIDLTLTHRSDPPAPHGNGDCDGPRRRDDGSLDMGTGFDCFSAKSYTRSNAISAEARDNRAKLKAAMTRHGFQNYFREWWHYQFSGGAPPATYDAVIPPR